MAIEILPSLLAADHATLGEACMCIYNSGADALHLDIMDGHFVPNLSFGTDTCAMASALLPHGYPISTHLMVTNPDFFAPAFIDKGATTILFHIEVDTDVRKLASEIHARNVRVGLALNPDTPAEAVIPYLDAVDEILCMTVFPGYGGQSFITSVLPKINQIRKMAPKIDIMVDGGINIETAEQCATSGANQFVAGSFLFKQPDMKKAVTNLRTHIEKAYMVT